jgi:type IV secretory pathway VirB2 component (pilin)
MTNQRLRLAAVVLCLAAMTAAPAHAQIALGSGGGLLGPVIQWFTSNIAGGLITIGVLAIGVLLLFLRFSIGFVGMMVIGALIMTHYQTIVGLF